MPVEFGSCADLENVKFEVKLGTSYSSCELFTFELIIITKTVVKGIIYWLVERNSNNSNDQYRRLASQTQQSVL